jgi:uncharacterized damage-inducible protein DinB
MTKEKFEQLAAYNRWANARLYAAALGLSDQSYRLHVGVFFGSLHGTLNHLLLTDRLWLKRLTGEGEHPNRLDANLFEDRSELTRARIAEDARLIPVVESYDGTASSVQSPDPPSRASTCLSVHTDRRRAAVA